MTKVLFICAGNMCRSPTGETLLESTPGYEVKSAGLWIGLESKGFDIGGRTFGVGVTQNMLDWADIVFVMEGYMKNILMHRFKVDDRKIEILWIFDHYFYGHPKLVDLLAYKLKQYGIKVDKEKAEEQFVKEMALTEWWWRPFAQPLALRTESTTCVDTSDKTY